MQSVARNWDLLPGKKILADYIEETLPGWKHKFFPEEHWEYRVQLVYKAWAWDESSDRSNTKTIQAIKEPGTGCRWGVAVMPNIFQKNFDITELTLGSGFDLSLPILQNVTRQTVWILHMKSQDHDKRYPVCPELWVCVFQNLIIAGCHFHCSGERTGGMSSHPLAQVQSG
jgi:hypothetical protein